jgi:hypothetical protein
MRKFTCILTFLIALFKWGYAQSSDTTGTDAVVPKVFMICDFCDMDYYKSEIPHLVFVRDQRLADFTVLFRVINTGSGGSEYTLEFSGKNGYEGITVQEKFNSTPNMSQNNIREGLLATLNRGSLHYLIHSPLAPNIQFEITGLNNGQPADSIRDKWNLWIFNVNANVFGSGQEYTSNLSFGTSFSANRTSEKNPDSGITKTALFSNSKVRIRSGIQFLSMEFTARMLCQLVSIGRLDTIRGFMRQQSPI